MVPCFPYVHSCFSYLSSSFPIGVFVCLLFSDMFHGLLLVTAPITLMFSITIRSLLATALVTALAVRYVEKTKEFKGNPTEMYRVAYICFSFGGSAPGSAPFVCIAFCSFFWRSAPGSAPHIYMPIPCFLVCAGVCALYIYGVWTLHFVHFACFTYACTKVKTP